MREKNKQATQETLLESRDYYIENGAWVFTAYFLRNRGYCCGSGCRHCPYDREKEASGKKNPKK